MSKPLPTLSTATVETDRLRLVPLTPDDAEALRRVTDDPAVIAAIAFLKAPFTLADAAALIAMNESGRDVFRGVRRRADDVLMGLIGAHDRGTGAVEIGYWIGTQFQRQGYAREAARGLLDHLGATMPLWRIVAECRPENRASWHILERLGFRPTGALGARPGRLLLEWRA